MEIKKKINRAALGGAFYWVYLAVWIISLCYEWFIVINRSLENNNLFNSEGECAKIIEGILYEAFLPITLTFVAFTITVFAFRVIYKKCTAVEVVLVCGTWIAFIYNLSFVRS